MTINLREHAQPTIIESSDFIVSMLEVISPGKVLLITSKSFSKSGLAQKIQRTLGVDRVVVHDEITPNPELADIQRWADQLESEDFSNIVVMGGGSAIDTAKVLSRLLVTPWISLKSMLLQPAAQVKKNVFLVAIPTTSGTGAEVTPFATVWDSVVQKKYSLTQVAPDVAILDASLTLTLAHYDTLYPALDALSHALESLWNKNRTVKSECFAIEAIGLICTALPQVLNEPNDLSARKSLQRAATLAGLAISTTRTALAHAISYPLTLKYGVPHGLACSFTLVAIIHELGIEGLNISRELADSVIRLLEKLGLENEIEHFVDWKTLMEGFDIALDPARTENFLLPVDDQLVFKLISASGPKNGTLDFHEN